MTYFKPHSYSNLKVFSIYTLVVHIQNKASSFNKLYIDKLHNSSKLRDLYFNGTRW